MYQIGEAPNPEVGMCADVVFEGDTVVKTSRFGQDALLAENDRWKLLEYAGQLTDEPVHVATLQGTDVLERDGKYHVQHVVEAIRGPSVSSLEGDERIGAVTDIAGQICSLSTVAGPQKLRTPVDTPVKNWHINPQGKPVLVDIYPPLSREADGSLKLGVIPSNFGYWERWLGTKPGALTRMLYSALDIDYAGASHANRLSHLLKGVDDWCYDVIPGDADPTVRDEVRRNIRTRFVPYLASTACRHARGKLHK